MQCDAAVRSRHVVIRFTEHRVKVIQRKVPREQLVRESVTLNEAF